MQEYVLSVKVANNAGVLPRVSGLFSRRFFNIKAPLTAYLSRVQIYFRYGIYHGLARGYHGQHVDIPVYPNLNHNDYRGRG